MTRHAALHDPLTGLPNRTLALDRLAHALARRQRERIDVAVFVLDLDRFKTINDSFGHAAGDDVLLAAGAAADRRGARRPTRSRGWAATSSSSSAPTSTRRAASPTSPSASPPRSPARSILDSGEHFFTVSTGIALAATRSDTPSRCSATPTRRSTAPRRAAAAATSSSTRRCAPARWPGVRHRGRAAPRARTRRARALLPAGDRPGHRTAGLHGGARALGATPSAAWSPRSTSSRSPRRAGLIAELGLQVLEEACRQTAAWQQQLDPAHRRVGQRLGTPGRATRSSRRRWPPSPRATACAPARWRSRSPRPCSWRRPTRRTTVIDALRRARDRRSRSTTSAPATRRSAA